MNNPLQFGSEADSHAHSLSILNLLREYDDFMMSIDSVADMGCGTGKDLEWWATQTTRDDNPEPLNINCVGYDTLDKLLVEDRHDNILYSQRDFETEVTGTQYDIIWSHDSFQYAINPLQTLAQWNKMLTPGGMLMLSVPQSTNVVFNKQEYNQVDGTYFNYTLVSLIHMLAISGFNCDIGFFQKNANDPWINCVVYKSEHEPMDPRTTRWYDLVDKELLPKTAVDSINACGHLRQQHLVLPWLDKSNTDFGQQ